jgi:Tol biopolymer transport system component/DNA-binding winged helix-turn-helix (wHTH) protein
MTVAIKKPEQAEKPFYRFDDVVIDRESYRIWKGERLLSLQPRAFDVLLFLIEHQGRLVEKRELLEGVWGESFVTDNSLTRSIKEIRRALGDSAEEPRYIETIPKRGYRFIAGFETVADKMDRAGAVAPATKNAGPRRLKWAVVAVALVVLVAVAFALRAIRSDSAVATGVLRTSQVTTWSGLDMYPELSPDGNWVAYSSDRTGSFEIFVKQLAPGGREIQVTSDGEQNFQPSWSPDGKMIVYHSGALQCIKVTPALGGVSKQIADFGSRPRWSPDGSLIAFQSDGITDIGPTAYGAMPPSTLWLVPSHGGEPRALTVAGSPSGGHGSLSWFPDGKRIVFISYDVGSISVWTVSKDGGQLKQVVPGLRLGYDPVCSPDGKYIYFIGAIKPRNFFLWRQQVSAEGDPVGEPAEVAGTGPAIMRHISISGDGKHLAYSGMSMTSNLWSIAVSKATGEAVGPPVQLTADTSFRKTAPSFSPDGKKIAFSKALAGSKSDVWLIDADGRNPVQMTSDLRTDHSPCWFPGGESLGYMTYNERGSTMLRLSLEGRAEKAVFEWGAEAAFTRISPDGRRIAFHSSRGGPVNIWTASLESGEARQLTSGAELMGWPCWSPDGSLIAFEMKRGRDTQVAIVPSDGGEIVQLTSDRGHSWTGSFSPDGDRIAFAGLRDGYWNIWWVSRATKKQKRVTAYSKPNAYLRSPAWSPLGDRIVYEYTESAGNIWIMELK